jgi:hypothetical protein
VDADQGHAREVGVTFDDLVGDPRQGALDRLAVEEKPCLGGGSAYRALRALLTFDSFPASQDRVKGVCVSAGL